MIKNKETLKALTVVAYGVGMSFLLLEIIIALLLHYPSLPRLGLSNLLHALYQDYEMNIIQYDSSCARYDPGLFYTLKPGSCVFKNIEFKNDFFINSFGLRDDEASLRQPSVIVLGDSFAMGWGVGQEKTYAQLIEKKSGYKVLNAAVSSYGTVREMLMLNRLDTTKLKYLIIHYSPDDVQENIRFAIHQFKIQGEQVYRSTIQSYMQEKRYYPGKYVVSGLSLAARTIENKLKQIFLHPAQCASPAKNKPDAVLFLNTVFRVPTVNLASVKIIVLGDSEFIKSLHKEKENKTYPAWINNLVAIDISQKLNKDCYYQLDDHLKPHGHQIIADEIMQAIGTRK